jgi:hypothetical protein
VIRIALLAESPPGDSPCQYLGNISPPLDGRWLKGGWTSHSEVVEILVAAAL